MDKAILKNDLEVEAKDVYKRQLQPKVIPAVHLPIIPGQAVPPLRPAPDLLARQDLRH